MGQPIPRHCAAPGCSKMKHYGGTHGIFFSVQEFFTKHVPPPCGESDTTLWACCMAHKLEAQEHILMDMSSRKQEEQQ